MKALALAVVLLTCFAQAEEKQLFNGKDLTGWDGNPELWSVKDGALTGTTTADKPLQHNTFLVWKGGAVSDFELTFKYRIEKGNSGIQYRSKALAPGAFGPIIAGYQADFEAGKTYSGILYEERGRGILAKRGEKTVIKAVEKNPADPKSADFKVEVVGELGKSDAIQALIKNEDWNEYRIVAKGNHLQHFINGQQTVDVLDEDAPHAPKEGLLALQIHTGPPMVVQFKDLVLKTDK
ncbi:MAG TPA: DUF1080 domain-containing protein [Chthoniobacteraceae bacterium]|jgi:hypothetical protein